MPMLRLLLGCVLSSALRCHFWALLTRAPGDTAHKRAVLPRAPASSRARFATLCSALAASRPAARSAAAAAGARHRQSGRSMPPAALPSPSSAPNRSSHAAQAATRAPTAATQAPEPPSSAEAVQRRSRLQFLLDIAQATFAQAGPPTQAQISALQRTLSECRRPRRRASARARSRPRQRTCPWSRAAAHCTWPFLPPLAAAPAPDQHPRRRLPAAGAVPLEELGLGGHAPPPTSDADVYSSTSSRSSSPSLTDGSHAALLGSLLAAEEAPRPPITYLLIYEDERVSLGIFRLPARARIPLHNHPGMTVLSRCVAGRGGGEGAGAALLQGLRKPAGAFLHDMMHFALLSTPQLAPI